jgi:hypothetical protein
MLFHRAIIASMFLAPYLSAHAPFETVTILRPMHAGRLAGVIVDPAGGPVGDALIEMVSCPADRSHSVGEENVLQKIKTDANGNFHIAPSVKTASYCLRVSGYGFNNLEVQVIIRRFSHDLRLTMPIAT